MRFGNLNLNRYQGTIGDTWVCLKRIQPGWFVVISQGPYLGYLIQR